MVSMEPSIKCKIDWCRKSTVSARHFSHWAEIHNSKYNEWICLINNLQFRFVIGIVQLRQSQLNQMRMSRNTNVHLFWCMDSLLALEFGQPLWMNYAVNGQFTHLIYLVFSFLNFNFMIIIQVLPVQVDLNSAMTQQLPNLNSLDPSKIGEKQWALSKWFWLDIHLVLIIIN